MFTTQIEQLQFAIEEHGDNIAKAQEYIDERKKLLKRDKALLKKVVSFDKVWQDHPLLSKKEGEVDEINE